MKLSTRSLYGLRMMYQLALSYKTGPLQLAEIANRESISEKYLGQIVLLLRSSGMLSATRGNQGGYHLPRHPREFTLLQLVECLEGDLLGLNEGGEASDELDSVFATNIVWNRLRQAMHDTLSKITLEDLTTMPLARSGALDFVI